MIRDSVRDSLAVTLCVLGCSSISEATLFYVDVDATGSGIGNSWANAFTDLQAAINAAQDGDEIVVAEGTYFPTPSTDRDASFHFHDEVQVFGGFDGTETDPEADDAMPDINVTILSGDLLEDDTGSFGYRGDNSYHVIEVDFGGLSDLVEINGFTIRGGNANYTDMEFSYGQIGAGILIVDARGVPILDLLRCRVTDNTSDRGAGGIGGEDAGAELRDCLIESNRCLDEAEGLIIGGAGYGGGSIRATRCQFRDNHAIGAPGGGLLLTASDLGVAPTLANVRITENSAGTLGGGAFFSVTAVLMNCLIAQNEVLNEPETSSNGLGGGVYFDGLMTMTNCTVADNAAANEFVLDAWNVDDEEGVGAGIAMGTAAQLVMRNSILWGNRVETSSSTESSHAAQVMVYPGGTSVEASPIAWCDIENLVECDICENDPVDYFNIGDDLIVHDPLFVDEGGFDYRQRSGACSDSASDELLPDDVNDVDENLDDDEPLPIDLIGADRVRYVYVDMGAYEWCFADLNVDGLVDGGDWGTLLGNWGTCSAPCLGDLTGDGIVDGADSGLLASAWGECSGSESFSGGGGTPESLAEEYGFGTVEEFSEWLATLDAETIFEILAPLT